MKRIASILIVVCMSFCLFSVQGFAEFSDSDIISFNEYYSTLKNEYAKYGDEYTIIEYDHNHVFTRGELNDALNCVQNYINFDTDSYKDMGNGNVAWNVGGYALFEYTEPNTGFRVSHNTPFGLGRTFYAGDYTI